MLEQAYFVSGIVAAIGVVATLLYLATQIRQNTRAVMLGTGHDITVEMRSILTTLTRDESVARIFHSGARDFDSLDGLDKFRFYCLMRGYFHVYQDAHLQYLSGTLNSRHWNATISTLAHNLSNPGVKLYWSTRRDWYLKDFQEFIDETYENLRQWVPSNFKLAGS